MFGVAAADRAERPTRAQGTLRRTWSDAPTSSAAGRWSSSPAGSVQGTPRNVLIRRDGGELVVRPFRGLGRCAYLGSNQGPPACEAGALPLSYTRRSRQSYRTGGSGRPDPRMLCGPVLLALPTPAPPPAVHAADVVIGALGGVGSVGRPARAGEAPGRARAVRRAGRRRRRPAARAAPGRRAAGADDRPGGRLRPPGALARPGAAAARCGCCPRRARGASTAPQARRCAGWASTSTSRPSPTSTRAARPGFRSFGSTPKEAGKRVVAAMRGLHDGGVAGCVKHFPGLGNVGTNTDCGRGGRSPLEVRRRARPGARSAPPSTPARAA